MKKKQLSLLLITLSLVASLFMVSCDVKNPVDGVELRANTIPRTTIVSLSIFDAKTEKLITSDVNVKFLGKDGSKVISLNNKPIADVTTKLGVTSFAIADATIPSSDSPVEVTAVVTVDGYVSSSVKLHITSPGASTHSIELANLSDLPNGVESKEATESGAIDGSSKKTKKDIIFGSSDSDAQAIITIPKGTILMDKNGNKLTGSIKTRVTHFSPKEEKALNSFPGGFAVNEDGNNGSFLTAGFVAIDMTVGGTKVTQFSSGVAVDINVPKDLKNPSGGTVSAGDEIPLWSYNEETGEWKREGVAKVPSTLGKSANSNGSYRVSTTIKHLSYWNLDWFQNACYEGITINIVGSCFPNLKIKARRADGQYAYFYSAWVSADDKAVHLYNAPRNVPVFVELWDYSSYPAEKVAEMQIDDLCGTDVDFPVSIASSMTEVTASASAICHNPDGSVKSVFYPNNFPLYAKEVGTYNWFYVGEIIEGEISACLKIGTTYVFGTYIYGYWVEYPWTITQDNYEFIYSDLNSDYTEAMRGFCGN